MRIILADHNVKTLKALKTLLIEQSEFSVVGEAYNADELVSLLVDCPTDIVLLEVTLPGCPLSNLIKTLQAYEPRPKVIVMGSNSDQARAALSMGADAYVSKGDPADWLLERLRSL